MNTAKLEKWFPTSQAQNARQLLANDMAIVEDLFELEGGVGTYPQYLEKIRDQVLLIQARLNTIAKQIQKTTIGITIQEISDIIKKDWEHIFKADQRLLIKRRISNCDDDSTYTEVVTGVTIDLHGFIWLETECND